MRPTFPTWHHTPERKTERTAPMVVHKNIERCNARFRTPIQRWFPGHSAHEKTSPGTKNVSCDMRGGSQTVLGTEQRHVNERSRGGGTTGTCRIRKLEEMFKKPKAVCGIMCGRCLGEESWRLVATHKGTGAQRRPGILHEQELTEQTRGEPIMGESPKPANYNICTEMY